ncbi:MAG: mechanosensitive ion channel domain-containing protein [Desulfobaccales bacterium]
MNNAVNYYPLYAALSQVQNYFLTHILVWTMLVQLMVVGILYLLARVAAEAVRPRLRRQLDEHPGIQHSLGQLGKLIVARLVSPIIAVVLLWLAYRVAWRFHWPNHGIRIFLSLFLAWVAIRLVTSQMKNRTLARILSFMIWSVAALDIVHLLYPFLALLDSIHLSVSDIRLSVLDMIRGLIVLGVLFWVSKKISMFFEHWIKTVQNVTPSVRVLMNKLLTLTLFTLVSLGVLSYMGINLTALAVFSGAIGLGIGFGLQKIFSNLISGLIILADKSIKPGDVIQVGETYGWINYLGGRYISVVTRDATEYLIPNEDLITNKVVNWSFTNNLLRLKIPVGVGYGSDLKQAMDLMLEAAREEPRILTEPGPSALLMGFGDNSVTLELRVWIRDPQNGVSNVKSQVRLGVWQRFKEHGIDLPFPQRVLHHQPVPEVKIAVRPQGRSEGDAAPGVDLLQPA